MKDYDYRSKARYYEILERNKNISKLNGILHRILKKNKVEKVLDMTCGTGSQAIYLHKKGYVITASDISKEMILIASKKYPRIRFRQADMRKARIGRFDAVITIYNAIGHLSKQDFKIALRNVSENLKKGGIYIFDIFNLDFMEENFIGHEFIDVATESEGLKIVRFNRNKLDRRKGIMTMNQRTYIQKGFDKPKIIKESWQMQIYYSQELKSLLESSGFRIERFLNIDGKAFERKKSLSILTIARKI